MPNGYFNKQVAPLKKSAPNGPKLTEGVAPQSSNLSDTQKNWPEAGPAWKGSLNSGVKFPVVKTHVVKKGVD